MLLFVVVAGLYLLDRYCTKHAFDDISYDIKSNRALVEIGEVILLETTITNTGRLPISFLKTGEILPDCIALLDADPELTSTQRGPAFISETFLLPRQQLVRTVKATMPRRGRYYLIGATLTAGGFLGLSEKSKEFHILREFVLIPKLVATPKLNKMLGRFIGDVSINRFTLEDPILTIGFRDYTDRDPMRSISWKQTARFGKLMVKNFDHTLDLSVTVIVNAELKSGEPEKELEALFSLARTVCEFLEDSETPYRFITNVTTVDGTGSKSIIPDGLGPEHLVAVLELLGRATYHYFESFVEIIAKTARSAEQGRAHILLTPDVQPEVTPYIHKLRARTGRDVMVITPELAEDIDAADHVEATDYLGATNRVEMAPISG